MPRPRKRRFLDRPPRPAIFKPAGVPLQALGRIRLLHEELEALRLADIEGLTQEEAAERMGISRPTFGRVLAHARRQVALALTDSLAIEIEGGVFAVRERAGESPERPRGPRRPRVEQP